MLGLLFNTQILAQEPQNLPLTEIPALSSPPEREYVIGTEEQLEILVWQNDIFSKRVAVRSDGKVTMPFLGDIQAAGLKVSTFKERLEERLKKYLKTPRVTISVGSSKTIRVALSGVISQEIRPPRGTTLLQVVRQLLPNLQQIQPPPNLTLMKVIGVDEEFPVNGLELLAGKAPQANIRLEWGDQIYIPSQIPETPIPAAVASVSPVIVKLATLSPEDFEKLLQQFPDAQELLQSLAVQSEEDGTYSINLSELSEEQREELGEDVLAELELYATEHQEEVKKFTDITLAGISINLNLDETVEAFLAIPNPDPGQLPTIKHFREGELVQKGETEEDDIVLEEIQDAKNQVILRKGTDYQPIPLQTPFSQAKLSGVLHLGTRNKAFFIDLTPLSTSKRPGKRLFEVGDEIEEGVLLADISDRWALLRQGDNTQLVLLRDSLNRATPTPAPAPLPTIPGQIPGEDIPPGSQPEEMLQKVSPDALKAIDTFSKLFFATPIF